MIYLDEIENNKLYKKKFYFPIDIKNKTKGSCVFLLGGDKREPNYNPLTTLNKTGMFDPKYFESYFIEKSVLFYINNEGYITTSLPDDENVIVETDTNIQDVFKINPELKNHEDYLRYRFSENKIDDKENRRVKIPSYNISSIMIEEPTRENLFPNIKNLSYDSDHYNKLYYYGDEPVAYCSLNKYNKEIEFLEVREDYRGRYIGTRILKEMVDNGAKYIKVAKENKVAKSLFLKNSFYEVGENNYDTLMSLYGTKFPESLQEASTYDLLSAWTQAMQQAFSQPAEQEEENDLQPVMEGALLGDNTNIEEESSILKEEVLIEDGDIDNEEFMKIELENGSVLFPFEDGIESVEEGVNAAYNNKIHNIIYNSRFKTPKEVLDRYEEVKRNNPYIKNTHLNISQYNDKNLIIDLSYYNKAFLDNCDLGKEKFANIYIDYLKRLIFDKRLGAYTKKMVVIPLASTFSEPARLSYSKDLNLLSCVIYSLTEEKNLFKDFSDAGIEFVLVSFSGYMKFNPETMDRKSIVDFKNKIIKLAKGEIIDDDNTDSKRVLKTKVIDKIEKSQGVKIDDITSNSGDETTDKLVKSIDKAIEKSNSEEEVIYNLNSDETVDGEKFKDLLLKNTAANGEVKLTAARDARLNSIRNEFMNKNVRNKSVKELLEGDKTYEKELPSTKLNIETVNEEWSDLKFVNFNNVYDPDEDIVAVLNSLSENKKRPIVIRDIKIEDTSTYYDAVETWTVKMEDSFGKRWDFVFDIPKIEDKKFMFIKGNRKKINGQFVLIPISKTDLDTVQIVSSYKKIFVRRFGMSNPGKSFVTADLIIKTLNKNNFKDLKITFGDNTNISKKYELPMDYIDLSTVYSKLETPYKIFYFNQDEIRADYTIQTNKGIPYGYDKTKKEVLYYDKDIPLSSIIAEGLGADISGFNDAYHKQKPSTKYHYSQSSILGTKIPMIVMLSYNEGLTKVLEKSGINYDITQQRPTNDDYGSYIRFKDGYIWYEMSYRSSLLMNGLRECNTEDYSISDIDNTNMWLDFLDIFGGRILADGLDNFYELMLDPITKEVLERYNITTDYVSLCLLANDILVDNKYFLHTNPESNRYRTNELIAAYAYQCISTAYGNYSTSIKKGRIAPMTMKRTAIIDALMADPTSSDKSILNLVQDWEDLYTFSYKGNSGMNSDRSYSLDKRTYNDNMTNIVAMSTGFAGNVGVNRELSIDANIEGKRGYIKIDKKIDKLTKALCPTEAINPFSTTNDDPFRSAMGFIQTANHSMRIKGGFPNLITNGADQAIAYLASDTFAFKAKKPGKVVELTDEYIIIAYDDGTNDYVNLVEEVEKNSNGGIYIPLKLDANVKLGQRVKPLDIVAYDPLSLSKQTGVTDSLCLSSFALCKSVIMTSDEGYEDSTMTSNWISNALATDVVDKKEIVIPKGANILSIVKKGQAIKEGESLCVFQNDYDEEEVNILLKNLSDDEEQISEYGRIPIKSHVEGVIQDIKISRTVDIDQLSESLQKLVNDYERPIIKKKKLLDKYGIDHKRKLPPTYTLPQEGKMKDVEEGVKIEIYCKYLDKFSVGDKLVNSNALKGVCKDEFPIGKEPTSEYRPDEKIHVVQSVSGVFGRMVSSIIIVGTINKGLIELDRQIKNMFDIPWKYLDGETPKDINPAKLQ